MIEGLLWEFPNALNRDFTLNESCTASGALKPCWQHSNLHSSSHWPGNKVPKIKKDFSLI